MVDSRLFRCITGCIICECGEGCCVEVAGADIGYGRPPPLHAGG